MEFYRDFQYQTVYIRKQKPVRLISFASSAVSFGPQIILLLSFVLICIAPSFSQGIKFEEGLTWEQILQKAKTENKYIFVDCYATWNSACKTMDKNVYPDDSLGIYMNEHFISVKLQLDETKQDDEQVKSFRRLAKQFKEEYAIHTFPTYLFFSPEGKAVHKDIDDKWLPYFRLMAEQVIKQENQYYIQIDNWKAGEIAYKDLPALASIVKFTFKEPALAEQIARDYRTNYLDKLSEEELLAKNNLFFLRSYPEVISFNDRVMDLASNQSAKLNSITQDTTFSNTLLVGIIRANIIWPALTKASKEGKEPDWKKIESTITKQFGAKKAEEAINFAGWSWADSRGDNVNRVSYMVKDVERMGYKNRDILLINNWAWDVFLYSPNKSELQTALKWADYFVEQRIIESAKDSTKKQKANSEFEIAMYRDTKANLLYKLGRKEEAIALETKAAAVMKEYEYTVKKMKNNEKTWANLN